MIVWADLRVKPFILERLRNPPDDLWPDGSYEAMGFENAAHALQGGVLYNNYTGHDVQISAAGDGNWLTPCRLHAIFAYPFMVLDVARVTVSTAKGNKRARKFIERVGFKQEGVLRRGHWDGQNAIIYGMLLRECRWLDDRWVQGYGQKLATAA